MDAEPSSSKHDDYLAQESSGSVRDNTRLADLGYRPELKRDFSALETFGVAFSIMYVTTRHLSRFPPFYHSTSIGGTGSLLHRGVVPSIASTIIYNLPYGGPVSMIWGWALSSLLIMFVGLAMVCSATSGAGPWRHADF
jgi:hypothetical protein